MILSTMVAENQLLTNWFQVMCAHLLTGTRKLTHHTSFKILVLVLIHYTWVMFLITSYFLFLLNVCFSCVPLYCSLCWVLKVFIKFGLNEFDDKNWLFLREDFDFRLKVGVTQRSICLQRIKLKSITVLQSPVVDS